jgi:hypothetical protein
MHAGCGALCGASACVSVPTTSVPILESDRAHAPYFINDCLYRNPSRMVSGTEIDYNKTAMGLPPVTSAVFLIAN